MFRLTQASDAENEALLEGAQTLAPSTPRLMTLDGPIGEAPFGFVHDRTHSEIGRGERAFAAAREAFRRWDHFDLGWTRVANPQARIVVGELVAVECLAARLWSTNISRIVETVDAPDRFGFLYATTSLHVEEGQERFLLSYDSKTESVFYLLEARSRPRHILARLGYPFSRAMQKRFARDSHARMKRAGGGEQVSHDLWEIV